MTGSRRLVTWLSAGMIIVAGAPAAYAAPGAQPRDSATCGGSPGDFTGGFHAVQYSEVGYFFDTTTKGTVTVYYLGSPVDQGPAEAADGVITWTLDGATYTSTTIECGDTANGTRVTAIVANSGSGGDQVTLTR